MVNVALSLSTKETPNITDTHWTLVPLYWALAGMVRVSTVVPSELTSEITRSLRISGKRSSSCVPLTLHKVWPPLVSHVKTADWFTKTVEFSGGRRISGVESHYREMAANFHVWVSGVKECSSSLPWATRGIEKLMSNTATTLSDDLIARSDLARMDYARAPPPQWWFDSRGRIPETNNHSILSGAWEGVLLCCAFKSTRVRTLAKMLQVHFLTTEHTNRVRPIWFQDHCRWLNS